MAYLLADGKQCNRTAAAKKLANGGSVLVLPELTDDVAELIEDLGLWGAYNYLFTYSTPTCFAGTATLDGFSAGDPEGWYWTVDGAGQYQTPDEALDVANGKLQEH